MSDTKSSLKVGQTMGYLHTPIIMSHTFQQIVMKVAVLFQKHMEHFKCYRAFCASHQIVKELLGMLLGYIIYKHLKKDTLSKCPLPYVLNLTSKERTTSL